MHISNKSKSLFLELLNDSSDDEINENELCLISKQPLVYNNITLSCGHKFNYTPLLKEVVTQKLLRNPLNVTVLATNEIQCPYCRIKQPKLLPFIPTEDYRRPIRGVTAPSLFCMNVNNCTWKFKNGKRKGECCGNPGYENENGIYCSTHHKCFKSKEKLLSWNKEMEDLKKFKIVELKAILHNNNLKKTGNKTTLISRIVTNKICVPT